MADCHEAIIDRETYAKVQAEMERRAALVNPTYCFTKKIRCGVCGNAFTRKKGTLRGKTYVHWICRAKKEPGMTCASENFSEEELMRISAKVLGLDSFDEEVFNDKVREITVCGDGSLEFRLYDTAALDAEQTELQEELNVVAELVQQCVSENAHTALDQTEYQKRYAGLVERFDRTKERLDAVSHAIVEKQARREQIERFLAELEKQDGLCTEFDESLWVSLVDFVTVFNKEDVRFTFKDGTEIRA